LYCTFDDTEIGIKSDVSPYITQQTINPLLVINDTSVINTINNGGSNIESNVTALILPNQYVTLLQLRKANMIFSLVTTVLMIFVPYIAEAIFKPNDHLKVRTSFFITIHKELIMQIHSIRDCEQP